MSKGSILRVSNVYLLNSYRIPSDPALSDIFRLSNLTVGNRRIRHPTTSCRNPIPKNPTTSDRILSEVVGFRGVSCRIRWDPTVGFLVLGIFCYWDTVLEMKMPQGSGKKVVPNSVAQLFFVLNSVVQSFSVPNSAGIHFLSLILTPAIFCP